MNYTDEQIEKQFDLLPDEVQDNLFSSGIENKVQTAGVDVALTPDQIKKLNSLVNFVILDLVKKDEFTERIIDLFGLDTEVAEGLVQNVSNEIFKPMEEIRIKAIEKRSLDEAEERELFSDTVTINEPEEFETKISIAKSAKIPDVAPENLPTNEKEEPLFPPIPLKVYTEDRVTPAHTFEEKMKNSFTTGQQSLGAIAIETPSQTSSMTHIPKAPPIYHADPYREPIE